MGYKGYFRIFLGLIFVFFNFTINGFDIFPDPVGYILIISSLVALSPLHNAFRKAVHFAGGLLVFSSIDFVASIQAGGNEVSAFDINTIEMELVWILSILGGILTIAFLYLLCKGTTELLEKYNFSYESRITKNCFVSNIVMRALTCMPFIMFFAAHPVLSVLFIITGIIFSIWLMMRIYKIYKLLEANNFTEFIEEGAGTNCHDTNHDGWDESRPNRKFNINFKFIAIILCILTAVAFVTDIYIKKSFGDYTDVSYRMTDTDFKGFFSAVKSDENMTIGLLELYFDRQGGVTALDMNYSKIKDNKLYKYKSSYNMQGAGLSNLLYTGCFEVTPLDDRRTDDDIWRKETQNVFKALSDFPVDNLIGVVPSANVYHLGLRDIINSESGDGGYSWFTKNTYKVEYNMVEKIDDKNDLKGNFAVFMLQFDLSGDPINEMLSGDSMDVYTVFLKLD